MTVEEIENEVRELGPEERRRIAALISELSRPGDRPARVATPRLANPEQMPDFELEVSGDA